jgi:hypothetical protein
MPKVSLKTAAKLLVDPDRVQTNPRPSQPLRPRAAAVASPIPVLVPVTMATGMAIS